MVHTPRKMNINAFTADGKNYRQEDRLDLTLITDFLESEWYRVASIFQPWRNVCAYVERDGQSRFFKMASTAWVGERLKNEITWNNNIGREIGKNLEVSFTIPRIYETGKWNDLPYYISEAFDNILVAEKWKDMPDDIDTWLKKIVEINRFFLSLDGADLHFHRDEEFPHEKDYWAHLVRLILSWSRQVSERDLWVLEKMIEPLWNGNICGVNHGDFVPWNMLRDHDRIILIDGEHGSAKTPRYYDIAYLYHRFYTIVCDPELADRYLSAIVAVLDPDELARFHSFFPVVLASRTIGGYFDAKVDGTSFEYHDSLRDEVLGGKFQNF